MKNIAFIFPGQGSQSVKMLDEIAQHEPIVEATFKEASDALGYDLWEVTQNGPQEKLDQTVHTQPALLASSVAIWRVIQSKVNFTPSFLAGHSLGEYSALVCANAMAFQDAVKLVNFRAQAMQSAVPQGLGAMAAILGLGEEIVTDICIELTNDMGGILSPANFNSLGQTVIAGHKNLVLRAVELAKEAGAKLAVVLPVSVPSHCKLMRPAAIQLVKELPQFPTKTPLIPVINNVDVEIYSDDLSIYDGLVRQLYSPVRWVEIIQYCISQGTTNFVECGPGKILSGLGKRIDKKITTYQTNTEASLTEVINLLS